MAHSAKPKKRGAGVLLIAFLLLLTYMVCGLLSFLLMGGYRALPFFQTKAAPGYRAEGQVSAMRLAAPEATDEAGLRAYFQEAIAFAQQQNHNTLVFGAKQGLQVWWRDDVFPAVSAVAAQDGFRRKLDPLDILCQELSGKSIQLWLELDPYEGGEYDPSSKSEVAKLVKERGEAPAFFSAQDEEYRILLAKSLAQLPAKYPISGYVFSGFSTDVDSGLDKDHFTLEVERLLQDVHAGLAGQGRLVPLSLAFSEDESHLSVPVAARMVQDRLVRHLMPTLAHSLSNLAERVSAFGPSGLIATPDPADTTGLFLFTASRSQNFSGLMMGTYPAVKDNAGAMALATSVLQPVDATLPTGFELPQILGVNYPAQNAKLYTDGLFIMGTSNPALPLLMDGAEIENRTEGGLFGAAVSLEMGENSFTFSQGEKSMTLMVERAEKPASQPSDNSSVQKAPAGQTIRIVSDIASALTDPANMAAINETFPKGAVMEVVDSVEAGGTWNYKLKSGDFVPGYYTEWLSTPAQASFTGLAAEADDGGEWLTFQGQGTPAAYVAYGNEDGSLKLTFYDTALDFSTEGFASELVESAAVSHEGEASILTLQTRGIWGYSLEYTDGVTRLFLKRPPKRSDDAAQPLKGVRVMLDPGHGDADIGSPGVLWDIGPHEKDINLALAQATAYRLKQLGAEVIMTRSDDSFPTLNERLVAQTEQKPDFFLALHHNAMEPDKDLNDVKGVEVYYYHPYDKPPSRQFAQNLIDRVCEATGRTYRQDPTWSFFYVTRTTVCPSVLLEYGFAMNPAEYEDITSAEGIYAAAFATADGILASVPF